MTPISCALVINNGLFGEVGDCEILLGARAGFQLRTGNGQGNAQGRYLQTLGFIGEHKKNRRWVESAAAYVDLPQRAGCNPTINELLMAGVSRPAVPINLP